MNGRFPLSHCHVDTNDEPSDLTASNLPDCSCSLIRARILDPVLWEEVYCYSSKSMVFGSDLPNIRFCVLFADLQVIMKKFDIGAYPSSIRSSKNAR